MLTTSPCVRPAAAGSCCARTGCPPRRRSARRCIPGRSPRHHASVAIWYLIDSPSVSASPPNRPMSRYTQRVGSSGMRWLTSTTSACTTPGVAHHGAARLDQDLRQVVAEMLGHRVHDRRGEAVHRRHLLAVAHGEAAAEIDHAQIHAGVAQVGEQHAHPCDGDLVGRGAHLLASRRGTTGRRGRAPSRRRGSSDSRARSTVVPNLRDSGQSAPLFSTRRRQ